MLEPIQTVDISSYLTNIKLPEDYFSVSYGFPNKRSLLSKGLDTGITLIAIGYLKLNYAPKAIGRWKHNLRKQLGKELFEQAMHRTMLMYMRDESVELYLKHLSNAEQWHTPDTVWDLEQLRGMQMPWYIKSKKTGEYQMEGYDEGWWDEDADTWAATPYHYLISEDKKYASEYDDYDCASGAILNAEEDLEDYDIVFEEEKSMSEQMRKEFEDYSRGLNLKIKENGNYADKVVHNMWLTWQASRQSLVVKLSDLYGYVVGQISVADVEKALDAAGVRYEWQKY